MKQLSKAEEKEAEISMAIHDHTVTKRLLREYLWKAASEGHNTNKGYTHKDCLACDLALDAREALES